MTPKNTDIKKDWLFSFGCGQENANGYVIVKDATFQEARSKMFEMHGSKWSMMYSADEPKTLEMIKRWSMHKVDEYSIADSSHLGG